MRMNGYCLLLVCAQSHNALLHTAHKQQKIMNPEALHWTAFVSLGPDKRNEWQ